jgi:hypothetical protein
LLASRAHPRFTGTGVKGGHAEEVRTALPVGQILRDQAQVSFMDQCRRLKSGRRALIPQIPLSQPLHFVVNQWNRQVHGFTVPAFPLNEELRYLFADCFLTSYCLHISFSCARD